MKRGWRLWLACVSLVLGAAACSDGPAATPEGGGGGGGEGAQTTTIVGSEVAAPPPITPRLTGFFEQGNLAMLTIPVEGAAPQPLSIKTLAVRVEVVGRLARTEVTQVFHNHTERQTEGTYSFTLPAGAAISRLAMDVDGKLVEGELVERERARQIYEQIVRQQQDPALLEWQGGERFQTQVFPIPARGDKTVVLTYEQVLPRQGAEVRYRYALPNLEGEADGSLIGAFTFEVKAEQAGQLASRGYDVKISGSGESVQGTLVSQPFKGRGPLDLTFTTTKVEPAQLRYATREGERFFLLDLVPELPAEQAGSAQELVLAIDTSAGIGSRELGRAVEAARGLLEGLPPGTRYNVVTGDWRTQTCSPTPLPADSPLGRRCLEGLSAGGATDLDGLLGAAVEAARGMGSERGVAIVVFTDGAASLGELDGDLIRSRITRQLPASASLHAVAVGHAPDLDWLAGLASAARGHVVRMTPQDAPRATTDAITELIHEPLLTDIEVKVLSGKVEGLVPHRPVNLARGQALAVMGRLDEGTASVRVEGRWRGQPIGQTYDLKADGTAQNRLLVNFWARAVIDEMQQTNILRDKIVQTSLHYGVMSRYTSFLVLENDEAYKRFQVERRKEAERQKQEQEAQQAQNIKKGTGTLQDLLNQPEQKPAATGDAANADPKVGQAEGGEESDEEPREEAKADENGRDRERLAVAEKPADADANAPPPAEPEPAKELAAPLAKRQEERRNVGGDRGDGDDDGFRDVPGVVDRRTMFNGGGQRAADKDSRIEGRAQLDSGGGRGGFGAKNKAKPAKGLASERSGWLAVNLRDLEGRKATLGADEQARLLELYVLADELGKARAFLQELSRKAPADQRADTVYALLNRPRVRLALDREYDKAAQEQLARDPASPQVASDYARFLADKGRFAELDKVLQRAKLDPVTASALLLDLVRTYSQGARVDTLLTSWRASSRYTPGELYQLLTADAALKPHVTAHLHATAQALITSGDTRPEVMSDYVQTSLTLNQPSTAADAVVARCTTPTDRDARACDDWLAPLGDDPRIRALLKARNQARIDELQRARQQDIANPQLILQLVELLRQSGDLDAAMRRLSELVEFTPHDYASRVLYARQLTDLKRIEESCAQLAAAVQLNPSQRDTFKDMMRLRRAFTDKADAIRRCIVDGVSKLPVQRAVSLVLTWEDPGADVDLHIHEVGGEEVFFSHRESKLAGLLYYDITDGFGPEIYVLGSGPAGEYRLTLVYYRGSRPNLTGTLTILRNAGSPDETREDRPFTLPTANTTQQHPIGAFSL